MTAGPRKLWAQRYTAIFEPPESDETASADGDEEANDETVVEGSALGDGEDTHHDEQRVTVSAGNLHRTASTRAIGDDSGDPRPVTGGSDGDV